MLKGPKAYTLDQACHQAEPDGGNENIANPI
jgi:hypothetical protein